MDLQQPKKQCLHSQNPVKLYLQVVKHNIQLTNCILNRFSHTICWKSPISFLGMSGYEIYIFLKKNSYR